MAPEHLKGAWPKSLVQGEIVRFIGGKDDLSVNVVLKSETVDSIKKGRKRVAQIAEKFRKRTTLISMDSGRVLSLNSAKTIVGNEMVPLRNQIPSESKSMNGSSPFGFDLEFNACFR